MSKIDKKLDKKEFIEAVWSSFDSWQSSQQGQTDGYEYEKTFEKMMVTLGNSLLQKSAGDLPKTPHKKKR